MKDETDISDFPVQAQGILSILKKSGNAYGVRVFETPAHRAVQAARMLNCALGAIVKSLVFQESGGDQMALAIVSGENRVDLAKLGKALGFDVQPAQPDVIFQRTGFAVGSVPPIGITGKIPVIFDIDLMQYDRVWAAAGSANILMGLSPQALHALSRGAVMCISMKK